MNVAWWTALAIMLIEIGLFLFFFRTTPFFFLFRNSWEEGTNEDIHYCQVVAESIAQYALFFKAQIETAALSPLVVQELCFPQQFLPTTLVAQYDEVVVENVLELSHGRDSDGGIRTFTVQDQYHLQDASHRAGPDEVQVVPQMRWKELLQPTADAAFFFSTDYAAMADRLGWRTIPWGPFLLSDGAGSPLPPAPQLHLLSARSCLQLRYSPAHTVRLQLSGDMTYLVLDPSAADAWHLHPAYHARHSQSRVDLLHDDSAAAVFPDFQADYFLRQNTSSRALLLGRRRAPSSSPSPSPSPSASRSRATIHRLRAGQSLYVPPFFAVHSFNAGPGPGLFVDLTSLSAGQVALAEAEHMQLPFDAAHCSRRDFRIVAAQVFLSHVLSRTDSVSSVRSFARSLLRSRHGDAAPGPGPGPGGRSLAQERARLREEGSGSGSGGSHRDRTFRCLRDNSSWHAEMRNRLHPEKVMRAAQFVADRVNGVRLGQDPSGSVSVSAGARKIWLQDYADRLARWAMGSDAEAPLFIRECLTFDSTIPRRREQQQQQEEEPGPAVIRLDPIH